MRALLSIACLLLAFLPSTAKAAPPNYQCIPGFKGDVIAPDFARFDKGWGIWWGCRINGVVYPEFLWCRHGVCLNPDVFGSRVRDWKLSADPAATVTSQIETNVANTPGCAGLSGDDLAACTSVRDRAYKDFPPPAAPSAEKWAVVKAPSNANPPGTVPAYPWNGTTRGTSSNGRATQGSPCDQSVGRVEGGGNYFGVNGRTDQVARCEKVQ
jgi:hypothetical protein